MACGRTSKRLVYLRNCEALDVTAAKGGGKEERVAALISIPTSNYRSRSKRCGGVWTCQICERNVA